MLLSGFQKTLMNRGSLSVANSTVRFASGSVMRLYTPDEFDRPYDKALQKAKRKNDMEYKKAIRYMGCNEHYGHKTFALKRSEYRVMQKSHQECKRSIEKVMGLIDYLEYEKSVTPDGMKDWNKEVSLKASKQEEDEAEEAEFGAFLNLNLDAPVQQKFKRRF